MVKKLILATLVATAAAILVASVAPTHYSDGSRAKQSSASQAGYAAPQAQPQKQSAYSGSGNVIQAQQAPAAQQQGNAYGQSGQAGAYGQSGGQSGAGAYGSSGTSASSGSTSASSGSVSASQAVPTGKKIKLVTSLTGGEEVPGPADKGGTGQAWVTVDGSKVCWKVTWSGLSSNPAIGSHIHFGAKGVAGNIVVPFFGDARKASGKGVDQSCTTVQDVAVLNGLRSNPQNYYVNVHTKQFPKGAIRGQLALDNGQLALTGSRTPTLLGAGLGVAATGLALLTMFRYRPRRLAVGGAHARRR